MGRIGMNVLEGEMLILYPVVVKYGCILYIVNEYITAMDYTIVVSIHPIVLY